MAAASALQGGDVPSDPGLAAHAIITQPTTHESPADRWQRLKSRHQAEAEAITPRPSAQIPGSTLPVPDDLGSAGWSTMRPAAAEPFPELTDAPPWVIASPSAPVVSPAPAPVLASAPSQPATVASSVAYAPGAMDPFAPQPPVDVSPQWESQILAAAGRKQEPNEVPPMPVGTGGRRSVRPIGDITPFYDTTVDEDIREYADQRAAEYDVKFADQVYQPRAFPDVAMPWEPTNFYHYPLYFEDPALERYGHTRPFLIQPFVSGGRFMGQLLALPYQMTIDPICKPIYALGWYRPGECAPKLKYQIPFNAQAAAVEAGVVTGMFFLIP
ncbi:MAG TPA: hypothetical protein VM165_03595 [Planctomycetaceae bacterium]|nr:hypothetical protein [Planctomycetaceae bacterium]